MNGRLHIFVFFLLVCAPSSAQNRFPSLPPDPAFVWGRFGNGMEWYVAENPRFAKEGEVALLHRACQTPVDSLPSWEAAVAAGRSGIAPESYGYVETDGNYTMYRFKGVQVGAPLDSLLAGIRLAASSCDPSRQAVIFAGDVRKSDMVAKLQMFADLEIPAAGTSESVSPVPEDSRGVRVIETGGRKSVTVSVGLPFPGLSRDLMGTVVSAVSARMDDIFLLMVEKTLLQCYEENAVPVSSVRVFSEKSTVEGGLDRFRIETVTAPEYAGKAAELTGRLLGGLRRDGLPVHSFGWMSDAVMFRYAADAVSPVSNTSLVDRCRMASLRGASLSGTAGKLDYFNSRAVEDSVRLRHFNRFVRGLADKGKSLSLCVSGAAVPLSPDSLFTLVSGTDGAAVDYCRVNPSDTLSFVSPSRKKMKVSEKPEPLLGGVMWSFGNGTRVLYRRMPETGRISYSYIFRTGAASIAGIRDGEAPYIEDMFSLCRFGALSGRAFLNLLESNGITMRCRVSLSAVTLEGTAPAGKIQLLMKALAAATSPEPPSRGTFEWWLSCRRTDETDSLALALKNVEKRLHPGTVWSMERLPDGLDGSLAEKAYSLFSSCFSRSEDALLVLLAEQPEPQVLKYLRRYMACFRTGGRRLSAAGFTDRTLSGRLDTGGPGPEGSAIVSLSLQQPLNIDNYVEVAVARRILERRIAAATAGSGYYPDVRMTFSCVPADAVNLSVILRRASLSGLPGVRERLEPDDAATLVVDVLGRLASAGVGHDEFAAVRDALAAGAVVAKRDNGYLLEMAAARFVDRKDLVSRYPAALKGVTESRVDDLFKKLDGCGRVVYISDNI